MLSWLTIKFQQQKRKLMAEFEEQKHHLLQSFKQEKQNDDSNNRSMIDNLRSSMNMERQNYESMMTDLKRQHSTDVI